MDKEVQSSSASLTDEAKKNIPQLEKLPFVRLREEAKLIPKYFNTLAGLLINRSVIVAVEKDSVIKQDEEGNAQRPKSLKVRVLKNSQTDARGAVLIFSSRETLENAGKELNWEKDEEGNYYSAVIKGRGLFAALVANQYRFAVLDYGSREAFSLDSNDLVHLANGKVPPFRVRG